MYWKYHVEKGDLVKFRYEHPEHGVMIVNGTVNWLKDNHQTDPETTDDVDFEQIDVCIQSGNEEVTVTMDDLIERVPKDERETDIPGLSERLRLSGGISQAENVRDKVNST